MECKPVFHFCLSRAIIYIIFPMSLYYQNTRTRSGNFPIFSFMAWCTGAALHVTDPRLQKSAPVFSRIESIGLYRDVWIAAIASSRTRLATLSGVMCNTSQCELRSLRVNSGMLNVIRIVTYYTLPPLESPTSSWIAMAYSR